MLTKSREKWFFDLAREFGNQLFWKMIITWLIRFESNTYIFLKIVRYLLFYVYNPFGSVSWINSSNGFCFSIQFTVIYWN